MYCNYSGTVGNWFDNPDTDFHWWQVDNGELPTGIKRPKVTCPKCGRRMDASIYVCHDGCCLIWFIPAGHKIKGWWKKREKDKQKKPPRDRRYVYARPNQR